MRYLGGKAVVGKKIANVIIPCIGERYIEPFVGACWVVANIQGSFIRVGQDANQALITMVQHVQQGWIPPGNLSEDTYQQLKETQDPTDPLTAFAGFGCSYAGKWFGGYARSGNRNYAKNALNSILKKGDHILDVKFECKDYRETEV